MSKESLHWQCQDCSELLPRNPASCPVCGHSVFRPAELEESHDTGGEMSTDEFDTSDALDRLSEIQKEDSDPDSE